MKFDYDFHPTLVNKINYISHKIKRRNYHPPKHEHKPGSYEIIFIDYGELAFEIDKKAILLSPGECIIIPGGTPHSFHEKEEMPFYFLNIMFSGKIPPSILKSKISVRRNGCDLMKKLMWTSVQEKQYSHELLACCLTEFLIDLIWQKDNKTPEKLLETTTLQSYQSEIVNRAIGIISNEYHQTLDMQKMSMAIGISASHLRKLLREETGKNFSTLLREQRIAVAKHLLGNSNLSLEEIANSIGYRSLSCFFKVFKRSTGMSPKVYASSFGDKET